MNRKQFLILVVVLLVLGGAGLALIWQDIAAYRATGAKIGAKVLPDLKVAEVAELRLQDAKQQVTLARTEKGWVVKERGGYPASFQDISDLLIKLIELKVTQSEQVGASLLPRVELAEPGAKEGAGTLIEMKDGAGKPLARLIIGKTVLKRDPLNPLPAAKDGVPAGRYVLPPNAKDTVVVVSDPLSSVSARPGRWLSKEFIKVDRIRTLAVGAEGAAPGWKIARAEEWGQWRFAGGGGTLNPGAAVGAVNKLGSLAFEDVEEDAKGETTGKPVVAVAETFDSLVYRVKVAKRKNGNDYLVTFTVSGEPAKARVPEKGEKKEEAAKRDKEFAESRQRLVARVAIEKAMAQWTYVLSARELEPLLASRSEMTARKDDPRSRGGFPPGFPPGFR